MLMCFLGPLLKAPTKPTHKALNALRTSPSAAATAPLCGVATSALVASLEGLMRLAFLGFRV